MLHHIARHASAELISDRNGTYSGEELLGYATAVADALGPREGQRIALLAEPGLAYVAGMLGTWQSGAAYVPLCISHPPSELEHVITDSEISVVLVQEKLQHLLPESAAALVLVIPTQKAAPRFPPIDPESDAMILYTSGTTGKPKGAVHTHRGLEAQVRCLVQAWEWSTQDRIPHFLPLHHTHGIVNKLLCALYTGARCDLLPAFDAQKVWQALVEEPYTLFMAVPTIYVKLIQHWEERDAAQREAYSEACRRLRLMVSGSAALPVSVLEKWKTISGHVLLERYGMTEIGMALSNPLHGERRPGFVGTPLPGVEVRVTDEQENDSTAEGCTGELQVRGANLFRCYWGKPEATTKSFTADGWFRTGDMVAIDRGAFRIVGRLSTDIIKTGGYKVSAIEIEGVLLTHPAVRECCVIGLPDDTWGERVAAVLVLQPGATLTLEEIKAFSKNELAPYKIPTVLKLAESLPRNVMGKVVKGEVKPLFS